MRREIKIFDGTRISYEISGARPPWLVFIHGIGGEATAWRGVARFFRRNGYSTLAVDLRGHGLSGRPNSLGHYKVQNFARDISIILQREKVRKFTLVGHSIGAAVMVEFHKMHPGKALAYVFITPAFRATKLLKILSRLDKILSICLSPGVLRLAYGQRDFSRFRGTGDLSLRRILSDIAHTSVNSWIFSYANLADFDGNNAVRKIKKPTCIIVGARDSLVGVDVARPAKVVYRIVPEANHVILINNQAELKTEILDFLRKLAHKNPAYNIPNPGRSQNRPIMRSINHNPVPGFRAYKNPLRGRPHDNKVSHA
ncbi:alpha/beta hydrolase [Candidatus Woesearchaeota archaeon]|nr:alpha/beta hydrolase [Candidatus Woesearchaeota archaeon]